MPFGKGKLWIFSFSLDQSGEAFARDILFVPSIYNIVLNSLPNQQISYTIGREHTYFIPRNMQTNLESSLEIENRKTGEKFIPGLNISEQGTRLDLRSSIKSAGHYLVKNEDETLASLSFNYDRNESDLRYYSPDELEERIELTHPEKASVITNVSANFSDMLQDIQKGKQFWKWCVLLALLFIVTEVLIARFWKQ